MQTKLRAFPIVVRKDTGKVTHEFIHTLRDKIAGGVLHDAIHIFSASSHEFISFRSKYCQTFALKYPKIYIRVKIFLYICLIILNIYKTDRFFGYFSFPSSATAPRGPRSPNSRGI